MIVEMISTANLVKKVSVHIQSIVPEPRVVQAPMVTVTPIVRAEDAMRSPRVRSPSWWPASEYMCARCTVTARGGPETV
jgi:hypothetical protein